MVFVRRNTIYINLTYRKEFVTYCSKIVYDDYRPIRRAVSSFSRKRKRSAVLKEQNMAVCEVAERTFHSLR